MERKYSDLRSGLVIVALSLLTYIWIIPTQIKRKANVDMGPDFFPKLMVLIIGICGLVLIAQSAYSLYKDGSLKLDVLKDKKYRMNLKEYKIHIIFLISAVVYLIIMPFTGFVISSILFLIFLLMYFGHSKIVWCIFLSIVYVTAVYLIFLKVFKIRFPIGPLGF